VHGGDDDKIRMMVPMIVRMVSTVREKHNIAACKCQMWVLPGKCLSFDKEQEHWVSNLIVEEQYTTYVQ
jgi:hypothetical protein